MTQRLYNEKEIAAILRAAADESETGTPGAEVGLSVDELAQIGAESGLDPTAVRRAAARMDAAPSPAVASSSIWGGPVAHERTWTLDRELTSSEWELVLADIRRAFGIPGVVSVREGAFEWVHKTIDSFTAHVSATVRNGKTTFQVAAGDPPVPIVYFAPTLMVTLFGLPVIMKGMDMGAEGMVLWAFLVAALFLASRTGVKAHARRNRQKIDGLLVDMDRTLQRAAAPAANASEEAIPQPEPPTDLFEGVPDSATESSTVTDRNRSSTT